MPMLLCSAAAGNPKKISSANKKLGKGDSDVAGGKYGGGTAHYRNAWDDAQQAGAAARELCPRLPRRGNVRVRGVNTAARWRKKKQNSMSLAG